MKEILSLFAEKELPEAFGVRTFEVRPDEWAVHVEHPMAIARLLSFAKARAAEFNADVFLRGQSQDFAGMRPALFREPGFEERMTNAYGEFIHSTDASLPFGRFHRLNPGSVFQHYGLRTPWLDLVDNLYTALWFAQHSYQEDDRGRAWYCASPDPYGWLYLVASRDTEGKALTVVDLRKEQSSMNLRLHDQHGLSAASQGDGEPVSLHDYARFVIGRIRFPNSKAFRLLGALSTTKFMFPGLSLDASYRLVCNPRVNAVVRQAETNNGLPLGSLGRFRSIHYRRPSVARCVPNITLRQAGDLR